MNQALNVPDSFTEASRQHLFTYEQQLEGKIIEFRDISKSTIEKPNNNHSFLMTLLIQGQCVKAFEYEQSIMSQFEIGDTIILNPPLIFCNGQIMLQQLNVGGIVNITS